VQILIEFRQIGKKEEDMAGQTGKEIAEGAIAKIAEFRKLCEGLDEDRASRAPEGRWSPKQIISHLCGPEGRGIFPTLEIFLQRDTPEIDIQAENPQWSEKRSRMSLAELLAEFDREYERISKFIGGLSEEQLSRKAHIPMLKDSPLGEYPTLAQWAAGLTDYHVGFHSDHLREILQSLRSKE
jgi:hypothetical protein